MATMMLFPPISTCDSPGVSSQRHPASCCGVLRGAACTVRCKRWRPPGSVAHALGGQSRPTRQQLRGWAPTSKKLSSGLETYLDLRIISCKDFILLVAATAAVALLKLGMLVRSSAARVEQYRAVKQQQQQAYECFSSRVLLECC